MASPENEITVEVSYMEIYNEKVYDLLDLDVSKKVGLKVINWVRWGRQVREIYSDIIERSLN